MTRTQKRNRRRKEKRREKDKEQARAKEQGPCVFTIHEVDSDEWHSVCSEEIGYEDALSLHGGDSDDESSEQPELAASASRLCCRPPASAAGGAGPEALPVGGQVVRRTVAVLELVPQRGRKGLPPYDQACSGPMRSPVESRCP